MDFIKIAVISFFVPLICATQVLGCPNYSGGTLLVEHNGQDANGNHGFTVEVQDTGCKLLTERIKLHITHNAPDHLAKSEYTQWLLRTRGDFNKPVKLFLSDFPTGEYYVSAEYSFWIAESIQKSKKYEYKKGVFFDHVKSFPNLEDGAGNDSKTTLGTTKIGKYVDNRAPDLLLSGIPLQDAEQVNINGNYNLQLNVDDNTGISSVVVEGFGQTLYNSANGAFLPGEKRNSLSTNVNINTPYLPQGLSLLRITARDINGNSRVLEKNYNITDGIPDSVDNPTNPPVQDPTPQPQIGGEQNFDALFKLLTTLINQLLTMMSNLDNTRTVEVNSNNSFASTGRALIKTIRASKDSLKRPKKLIRFSKRFNKLMKKSSKTSSKKKRTRLLNNAFRNLENVQSKISFKGKK